MCVCKPKECELYGQQQQQKKKKGNEDKMTTYLSSKISGNLSNSPFFIFYFLSCSFV